jgi:DNA-binding transcriptional MerR regulator
VERRLADDRVMNHPKADSKSSLQIFDPDPAVVYSIDMVERLAQMPRRTILICCRHGLVSPAADPEIEGYCFDREAIRMLRRIEYLQVTHGINFAGIKFILDLADEVQLLRATLAGQPSGPDQKNPRKRNNMPKAGRFPGPHDSARKASLFATT